MSLSYWTFTADFMNGGIYDRFPLNIRASPQPVGFVDVFTSSEQLVRGLQYSAIRAIRDYYRLRRLRELPFNSIRDLPVFLFAVDLLNNRELRTPLGSLLLKEVTAPVIFDILAFTQSSEERSIDQMSWTMTLNPVEVFNANSAAGDSTGPPKWLKTLLWKGSWYTHRLNGVAAYALTYWMNEGGRTQDKINFSNILPTRKARKRALKLQKDLQWGELVSKNEIVKFVERFPKYAVIIMIPFKHDLELSEFTVFKGENFVEGSEMCRLINWEAGESRHWALTSSFQSFVEQWKNGGTYSFCQITNRIIKHVAKDPHSLWKCWKDHPEGSAVEVAVAFQHKKKQKKPCNNKLCAGTTHSGKLPPDHGKNEEHPHNKYFNEEEQDYDFCVHEDGDGKVPAFFAYDMETMLVEEDIEDDDEGIVSYDYHDSNFGVNLDEYSDLMKAYLDDSTTELDGIDTTLTVTRKRRYFKPNLIVLTNIYSSKKLDGVYDPEMIRFHGDNCVTELLEYVLRYNKSNCYLFAHNGAGFDAKFLLEAVIKTNLKFNPIMRGSSILQLSVRTSQGQAGNNVTFLDSMLHLPGSLASLLSGFFDDNDPVMALSKDHFPHLFNTVENQNYVGRIPDLKYFSPETIKLGEGSKKFEKVIQLKEWHAAQSGVWDFQKELVKYCDSDVRGLAALLKVYMEICIPKGGVPLLSVTMPSFVHYLMLKDISKDLLAPEVGIYKLKALIRKENPTLSKEEVRTKAYEKRKVNAAIYFQEVEEKSATGFAVQNPAEYNFIRKSLRGGRTEVRNNLMVLTQEEIDMGIKIMYQDVTSLYPAMQMMMPFPVGSPQIHWYTIRDRPCFKCVNMLDRYGDNIIACDCPLTLKGFGGSDFEHQLDLVDGRGKEPSASDFVNDPSMFGYVCCDLIPPKNLDHPVIQIYKRILHPVTKAVIGEKCECNLVPEDHKRLVLDTPTLKHALERGYLLEKVYRFDQYKYGQPPWLNISMGFYVDKERTSGKAPSATSSGELVDIYNRDVPLGKKVNNDREAYVGLYNHRVPGLGDLLLESMNTTVWERNKAQRAVYKTLNNCGWGLVFINIGKHAEKLVRPNHSVVQTGIDDDELSRLFQNVSNNTVDLLGCHIFDSGKRLVFKTVDKNTSPKLGKVYLPAGAMVPAYARLKLLKGLETCGRRVAMCDTDSIIYKTSLLAEENIPADGILGGWKEEDISKEGIVGFVGYGPKSYSIKTSKEERVENPDGTHENQFHTSTKLKGIQQTSELKGIDYETMKLCMEDYLSGGEVEKLMVPQWGIRGNPLTRMDVAPLKYSKVLRLMGDNEIKGVHLLDSDGKRSAHIFPRGWDFSLGQ